MKCHPPDHEKLDTSNGFQKKKTWVQNDHRVNTVSSAAGFLDKVGCHARCSGSGSRWWNAIHGRIAALGRLANRTRFSHTGTLTGKCEYRSGAVGSRDIKGSKVRLCRTGGGSDKDKTGQEVRFVMQGARSEFENRSGRTGTGLDGEGREVRAGDRDRRRESCHRLVHRHIRIGLLVFNAADMLVAETVEDATICYDRLCRRNAIIDYLKKTYVMNKDWENPGRGWDKGNRVQVAGL